MSNQARIDNIEEQIDTDLETSEHRHLQIDLLKRSVDPDDMPLLDYIEHIVPRLLEEFSLLPAKGGSGRGHPEWNPRWGENHDQSMLSHILNGIFPTLRIVRKSGKPISDTEERLYLISYTLHDLDKLTRVRNLSVADPERAEQFYRFLDHWLERLNVVAFFHDIEKHRDNVGWLIQNTQLVWGTNRNLTGFKLTLPTRQLNAIQEMCTFSDKIAFFIKKPSDVVERDDLREGLLKLSGGKFEFGYHQIAENKGMITNVINNALLNLLRDELGWYPLLFFPTGVVYLKLRESSQILPSLDEISEKVEDRLRYYCQGRLEKYLNGFSRDGKGLKFPDYYYRFFNTHKLLKLIAKGAFNIIREGKEPSSGKRLEKLLQLQRDDASMSKINLDFDNDLRVDQLAEFLDQVYEVVSMIVSSDQADDKILEILDLLELRDDFLSIPRDNRAGGVPLRWYFAAGKYLRKHRGLSQAQMLQLLDNIADKICDAFTTEINSHDQRQTGFTVLQDYIKQVVDINSGASIYRDFSRELDRYEAMKRPRQSEVGCSLCSSPFATFEQMEAEVVFAPQVYTGKRPLGSTKMKRGICEMCKVEMMLRQILIRSQLKLIGSSYEDVKIKWIYLYPSYFFTTETAKFMRQAYLDLKQMNFFHVRQSLRKGMQTTDFLRLVPDIVSDSSIPPEKDLLLKMEFDQNDLATFFFCGFPTLGKKPTYTESWAMPTFLGFLMALVFNAKVVISESLIPIFANSEEWKETVALDAPHSFVTHLLHKERFRLDEILDSLQCLASVYDLNIDVFQDGKDPNWTRLAGVARDIDTDKFYVFHYLNMWQRKEKQKELPPYMAAKYLKIYQNVGGEHMSLIRGLSERCFKFYGPEGFASNSILRVISIVEAVIINSPPEICPEDLKLEARGEISNFMERVHNKKAKGYTYLSPDQESSAIMDFVDFFFNEVFKGYCQDERALLRERRNRFNAGVEAWYHENWRRLRNERQIPQNEANMAQDSKKGGDI